MRYALAFITSFTLLLGITTYARVQAGEPPIAEPQAHGEKKDEPPKKEQQEPADPPHVLGHSRSRTPARGAR